MDQRATVVTMIDNPCFPSKNLHVILVAGSEECLDVRSSQAQFSIRGHERTASNLDGKRPRAVHGYHMY